MALRQTPVTQLPNNINVTLKEERPSSSWPCRFKDINMMLVHAAFYYSNYSSLIFEREKFKWVRSMLCLPLRLFKCFLVQPEHTTLKSVHFYVFPS